MKTMQCIRSNLVLGGVLTRQRPCPLPDLLPLALCAHSSNATYHIGTQGQLKFLATILSQPASLPGSFGALLATCKKPGVNMTK